jgi:hypothetical protein
MDDDFLRRDLSSPSGMPHRDNLFGWTVFLLLLIGFAFACWFGSYYIFGHPENPRSYRVLQKLKKLDPPKRFELTKAPPGEFLSAQKLYERYNGFSRLELERENDELLRNYIKNYGETKKLVPYIVGRFQILDSYALTPKDMFPSGAVALAQATDFQQVLIEHVYTTSPANVSLLKEKLRTGLEVELKRTLDLSAVVHIEKIYDGRLQFTVLPLLYGRYLLRQGAGGFSLEPPAMLNIEAGAPLVRTDRMQEAFKVFAEYRKARGTTVAVAGASPAPAGPDLVRVETAEPVPGSSPAATPPKPIAAASPVPTARPTAAATATASPALVAANATPRVAPAVPAPSAPAISETGVPLEPFLAAAPTPSLGPPRGATWQTFGAGKLPPGRTLAVTDATTLAEEGIGNETTYLRGNFIVTASGENRAVMRPQDGAATDRRGARVMVEFPAGAKPPPEGSTVARDDSRPFRIMDVRRGGDGEVTIYVREVTRQ